MPFSQSLILKLIKWLLGNMIINNVHSSNTCLWRVYVSGALLGTEDRVSYTCTQKKIHTHIYVYISTLYVYVYIYLYLCSCSGNTLWHLSMCLQHILARFNRFHCSIFTHEYKIYTRILNEEFLFPQNPSYRVILMLLLIKTCVSLIQQ
jgi:hypothetical protein